MIDEELQKLSRNAIIASAQHEECWDLIRHLERRGEVSSEPVRAFIRNFIRSVVRGEHRRTL